MWFKRIEPPRTFSNHIITEIAGRVEFFHMSSGWFDCTEPSLTTSLQGKQGLHGAYALVRVVQAHQTSSDLLEPHHDRDSMTCRVLSCEFRVVLLNGTFSNDIFTEETRCAECSYTSSGWFKRIEPPRTFSNHIMTDIAGRVEFFHISSEWFDCTEPSLYRGYALFRSGSSASNLLEPSRT